ncbi:hypothetical protein HDV03_000850 [Kappamyces sp. JEL0829]|nr:hypothetical protein HDV03_000850 [Kappamyces sp. JEL0829]
MSDSANIQTERAKVSGKLEEVETEITVVKAKLDKAEAKLESAQTKYENEPNEITKELKNDAKDFYDSVNLNLQRLGQELIALRQLETELVKERAVKSNTGAAETALTEKVQKIEETLNKYIQKASTVQISSLNFDTIDKDGYSYFAKVVKSPKRLDFSVPKPFKWPVPDKETDKRNTDAYLAYLEGIVKDYSELQAQNTIESPYLYTTVGVNPHHVTGTTDLYIIPYGTTALYYLRKHLARYNQMMLDEDSQKDSLKRKADEDANWAFGDFKAGRLKKMRLAAEDNMRDLIEDEEELILYDMRKRMENTPLFQIPPPAESHMPYFN